MKILIIQQKMIGDVLVSSILCEYLKNHNQNHEIHYLINWNTLAVIQNNPFIDKQIVFKSEYRRNKFKFYSFLKTIKKAEYDVVIDVYGKLESNLMSLSSNASIKIAFAKSRSKLFYTHTIPIKSREFPDTFNTIDDRLALIEPITGSVQNTIPPKIYLSDNEITEAKAFLISQKIILEKPLIMISILGSSNEKTYPLNYMAKLIDRIAKRTKGTLLFNYIPSQLQEAKELYELCKSETRKHISFETFAPSLRKFLALLQHCDLLIGNEGGSTNMAKALDIPTFAIFAPWIDKQGWHTFANKNNIAIHFTDYFNDEARNETKKSIKKKNNQFYDKLKPELFVDKLDAFLDLKILSNK